MVLEATGLCKSYRGRQVVSNVSLSVQSGRAVGLLGPNGAGKTTTFYMIVGLVRPDSGSVSMGGMPLEKHPIYVRARMGLTYLPQEPSVFRKLTVRENLRIILDNLNISRTEKGERADRLLAELGIGHLASQRALTLSGGERRRLEIARALVLEPKFLLLDEPYAGIDPVAVGEIQKIISDLRKKEIGILITDHNVRETLSSCDEAYLIRDGSVWIQGAPQEIVENESARQFYLGEDFRL